MDEQPEEQEGTAPSHRAAGGPSAAHPPTPKPAARPATAPVTRAADAANQALAARTAQAARAPVRPRKVTEIRHVATPRPATPPAVPAAPHPRTVPAARVAATPAPATTPEVEPVETPAVPTTSVEAPARSASLETPTVAERTRELIRERRPAPTAAREAEEAALKQRLLRLALGVTATLVAWGYLVYLAIDFGGNARNGENAAWFFLAVSTLGATACLFVTLMLATKLMGVLKGEQEDAPSKVDGPGGRRARR